MGMLTWNSNFFGLIWTSVLKFRFDEIYKKPYKRSEYITWERFDLPTKKKNFFPHPYEYKYPYLSILMYSCESLVNRRSPENKSRDDFNPKNIIPEVNERGRKTEWRNFFEICSKVLNSREAGKRDPKFVKDFL